MHSTLITLCHKNFSIWKTLCTFYRDEFLLSIDCKIDLEVSSVAHGLMFLANALPIITKHNMQKALLLSLFITLIDHSLHSQTIPYSVGRIVISSDGNEHDHDDWAATPMTLALLASRGLQDKVTLYTFSDHVWGSNHDFEDAAEQMRISAYEGQEWFGFEYTEFIEAVEDPEAAYEAMKREINKSSAEDPLTIIAAGPMHVVGEGIARAKPERLKHVHLISHSPWNNRHSNRPNKSWEDHSGWNWSQIEENFAPKGLFMDYIANQNGGETHDGLRSEKENYDWLRDSEHRNLPIYKAGSWDWLYARQLEYMRKNQKFFDPSDAGMIVYLLTGIDKTDPDDVRRLLENPIINNQRIRSRD